METDSHEFNYDYLPPTQDELRVTGQQTAVRVCTVSHIAIHLLCSSVFIFSPYSFHSYCLANAIRSKAQ
jgi:hypothetical protein